MSVRHGAKWPLRQRHKRFFTIRPRFGNGLCGRPCFGLSFRTSNMINMTGVTVRQVKPAPMEGGETSEIGQVSSPGESPGRPMPNQQAESESCVVHG